MCSREKKQLSISGKGIAEIGEEQFFVVEVEDFIGYIALSLPDCMRNPFEADLVYLMGGKRRSFDVYDYPRLRKRFSELMGSASW